MFIYFLGQYYHVLTSTSLVVVSSRTEDYDARPVPAAGKKIVGFRSANMYVVPAYSNTRMNIHLYQDTSIKNYLLQGKYTSKRRSGTRMEHCSYRQSNVY